VKYQAIQALTVQTKEGAITIPFGTVVLLNEEQAARLIEAGKVAVLDEDPIQNSENLNPIRSPKCPAAAERKHDGPGLWCFYEAHFLGRSAPNKKCEVDQEKCPLKGKKKGGDQAIMQ
jgi:hypothetical protein